MTPYEHLFWLIWIARCRIWYASERDGEQWVDLGGEA